MKPMKQKKWDHSKCNAGGNADGFVSVGTLAIYDNPPTVMAVREDHPCGCKIEGNGTLPHPLRIEFCAAHRPLDAKEKIDWTKTRVAPKGVPAAEALYPLLAAWMKANCREMDNHNVPFDLADIAREVALEAAQRHGLLKQANALWPASKQKKRKGARYGK